MTTSAPEPSDAPTQRLREQTRPGTGARPVPTPSGREADRAPSHHDDPLRGSRTSGIWVGTVGLGLLLVLLIVFIAQNTESTTVRFLGWEGQVSVAVALLIAAAAGILLTAVAGTLRILQLRHRTKRAQKSARKAARTHD